MSWLPRMRPMRDIFVNPGTLPKTDRHNLKRFAVKHENSRPILRRGGDVKPRWRRIRNVVVLRYAQSDCESLILIAAYASSHFVSPCLANTLCHAFSQRNPIGFCSHSE